MSNPLMGMIVNSMSQNNPMLAEIMRMRQSGMSAQDAANSLASSNPQFAQFMQQNQGKSISQVAGQYGVDLSQVSKFLK